MPLDFRDSFVRVSKDGQLIEWRRRGGDIAGETYVETPAQFAQDLDGQNMNDLPHGVREAMRAAGLEFRVLAADNMQAVFN